MEFSWRPYLVTCMVLVTPSTTTDIQQTSTITGTGLTEPVWNNVTLLILHIDTSGTPTLPESSVDNCPDLEQLWVMRGQNPLIFHPGAVTTCPKLVTLNFKNSDSWLDSIPAFDIDGQLQTLMLDGYKIDTITATMLSAYTSLQKLVLTNGHLLTAIEPDAFQHRPTLEVINLETHTLLTTFPCLHPGSPSAEVYIVIKGSAIATIDPTCLDGIVDGHKLFLTIRESPLVSFAPLIPLLPNILRSITFIDLVDLNDFPDDLSAASSLNIVYLNGVALPNGLPVFRASIVRVSLVNAGLSCFAWNHFSGSLVQLDLSYNNLDRFPHAACTSNLATTASKNSLKKIDLSHNLITEWPDLSGLTALETLHMNDNNLYTVSDSLIPDCPDLETLYLENNPLVCDSGLMWIKDGGYLFDIDLSSEPCAAPPDMVGVLWADVDLDGPDPTLPGLNQPGDIWIRNGDIFRRMNDTSSINELAELRQDMYDVTDCAVHCSLRADCTGVLFLAGDGTYNDCYVYI